MNAERMSKVVFYKITVQLDDRREMTRKEHDVFASECCERCEQQMQRSRQQNLIFTADLRGRDWLLGAIVTDPPAFDKQLKAYIDAFSQNVKTCAVEETGLGEVRAMMLRAYRTDLLPKPADDWLDLFNVGVLNASHALTFGEGFLDAKMTASRAHTQAAQLLFHHSLGPEIDRIFASTARKRPPGHPVQYLVCTDDPELRRESYRVLLASLYAAGRLQNRRYAFTNICSDDRFGSARSVEALYRSCEGGAMVIRYTAEENDDEFGSRGEDALQMVCEIAAQHKHRVLTVFCLPSAAADAKETIFGAWGETAFVELRENVAFGDEATAFLKAKAKAAKLRADKQLLAIVEQPDKGYTAAELMRAFDSWRDRKLRCHVYPQYQTTRSARVQMQQQKTRGSAYDRLQEMIGLSAAKSVMEQALNYFKAQKMFADRGLAKQRPSMHMVFTGNPGTAKTTVARLFAQIMKENKLLDCGELYEVGRADLVGKYVGQTAPLVKAAFKRAKGGVLFIDEAYALVDGRDGSYGDEAINTIVQEMENCRQDTVVIFAGYPDKMNGFLNKNPGLRSRIAFHVPFDDYDTDELCAIAQMIAQRDGLCLAGDANDKLKRVFAAAMKHPDFGNGRYARTVIEKAKMAHANRLVSMDLDRITDEDFTTLCADDIQDQYVKAHADNVMRIGFSA